MKVLIPCVNYADMLAVTLPAWLAVLPVDAEVIVVTAPNDRATREVVERTQARIVITDAWYRGGTTFNKARAMDEALGITHAANTSSMLPLPVITSGDVGLALDVDVFPFGTFPELESIEAGTIYGCARYRCASPAELQVHQAGLSDRRDLDLIPPKVRGQNYVTVVNTRDNAIDSASKCLGYFQLFRWQPGIQFGSHDTAGKYDLDFRGQFARRVGLEAIYVLHLGEQDRRNWRGRMLPKWGATA